VLAGKLSGLHFSGICATRADAIGAFASTANVTRAMILMERNMMFACWVRSMLFTGQQCRINRRASVRR
jgi:hypothetical protein